MLDDTTALSETVRQRYGVPCQHIGTVDVRHSLGDALGSFHGIVHVFRLLGHPRAPQAYAWTHASGAIVTALATPPTATAVDAVRAWLGTLPK